MRPISLRLSRGPTCRCLGAILPLSSEAMRCALRVVAGDSILWPCMTQMNSISELSTKNHQLLDVISFSNVQKRIFHVDLLDSGETVRGDYTAEYDQKHWTNTHYDGPRSLKMNSHWWVDPGYPMFQYVSTCLIHTKM